MAIQFGFVTLFVTSFPLAPVLALVNNYIEVRVDAFKLLNECRRPEPKGAQDIGSWGVIMGLMSTASVLTNAALTCFTCTRLLGPDASLRSKVIAMVLLEHLLLGFKKVLEVAVPDEPMEVTWQLKRAEHILSKVVSLQVDDDEDEAVEDASLNLEINMHDSSTVFGSPTGTPVGTLTGGTTKGVAVGVTPPRAALAKSWRGEEEGEEEEEGGWDDHDQAGGGSGLRRRGGGLPAAAVVSAQENRMRADRTWDGREGDADGFAGQLAGNGGAAMTMQGTAMTMNAEDYKSVAGAFDDFDGEGGVSVAVPGGVRLETDDGKTLPLQIDISHQI
jgi:anoctamin-10/anoctamin-7